MANYKSVTREEFAAWATSRWKDTYRFDKPSFGYEDVIVKKVNTPHAPKALLELRIFTSVVEGESRDVGKDAIRTVLYDVRAGKPLGKEARINRVEGATTVFERLDEKLNGMREQVGKLEYCQKCGSHMVERVNKRTQQKFLGCGAWPKCGDQNNQFSRYGLANTAEVFGDKTNAQPQSVLKRYPESIQSSMKALDAYAEPEDKKYTELTPENNLIPTAFVSYPKFKFPYFNPIQSTLINNGWHEADANLVCGTATSTGKSTVAELYMGNTLTSGKKVIYTSPLKALTMEKYEDWKKTFPDRKIMILTGDFKLSTNKISELNSADIICMTAEMLDVRTKNHKSEKSNWLFDVGLLINDETHLITSESRGAAVEIGVMKFAKLVSEARILCLSATMPNVEDFRTWLKQLNGKETHVLNSTWRPIPLKWNFPVFDSSGKYFEQQISKREIALEHVQQSMAAGRNTIVFCHDKNNGRSLMGQFKQDNIEAYFHNADLPLQERMTIEKWFRDTPGSVLIATSTLAYGLNTPCMDVVVLGTTRGINPVDDLDIIQEGGRAGRTKPPSYEYVIENKEDFDAWKKLPQHIKTGVHFIFEYNE